MRILIITQIFLPEMGALANRLYPIVRELTDSGHEVFIATGMPNYPAGKVFPEYRGKLFSKETIDGCTILRTAYFTTPRNKSKLSQLASYLSFIPAVFGSGIRSGKIDVVFVSLPPPFPVISAIALAKLRNAKLVVDIRDLWSDELLTYGNMSEMSAGVRFIRFLERWGYRSADLVTCTTESLIDTVVERGAKRERTFFLPNGADLDLFVPLPADNAIAREFPFGDRFVVMYSGLFGIKHGLEVLLEAAELLKGKKEIVFFLLGGGARREALTEYISKKRLDNVIIGNERSVKDVPSLIARADLCFASILPAAYPRKLISVKIFEYMACEKPVVGSLEGESASVIERSGGGLVVPPGDPQALADAIMDLYNDPARRAAMGTNGRQFVEKSFSRADWASFLEREISKIGANPSPSAEVAILQGEVSASPSATEQ